MSKLHARFSPSASERWMSCTASIDFNESLSLAPTESEYSKEGTEAHTVIFDYMLRNKSIAKKLEFTDEQYQEMTEAGWIIQNFVQENELEILFLEDTLHFTKDVFGTVDLCAYKNNILYVCDLKYGKGVEVEVENNPQLMLYGVMALNLVLSTYLFEGNSYPIDTVALVVFQPRINPEPKIATYSLSDIYSFGVQVLDAVTQIKDKRNLEFRSGKWCKFCPGKAHCPEIANEAIALLHEKPTRYLSVNQLVAVYKKKKQIESFLEEVEGVLKDLLIKGEQIEGLKLVEGRRTREWVVDPGEIEAVLKDNLIDESVYDLKLKSPNQIETMLKKKKIPIDILDGMFNYKVGSPTIKDDSNKKPEFKPIQAIDLLND